MSSQWQPITEGDPLPQGAVCVGKAAKDGNIYVARVKGECGTLGLSGDGTVAAILCHHQGKCVDGEVLVLHAGAKAVWSRVERGDPLPSSAVLAGDFWTEGPNYACRSFAGEGGKVNLENGFIRQFWYPGHLFPKRCGEILEILEGEPEAGAPDEPAEQPEAPPLEWKEDALCDGKRAEERAAWLVKNQGMDLKAARELVMREFPFEFRPHWTWWRPDADCDQIRAEERAQYLVEKEGYVYSMAQLRVKYEFPDKFEDYGGVYVKSDKFPHTLSIEDTSVGPKLKIQVMPLPEETTLVAVHYCINGGASMNFDIKQPTLNRTYTHVTPLAPGYPLCRHGDTVSYWLGVVVKGLIQEEPEGSSAAPEKRLTWSARH